MWRHILFRLPLIQISAFDLLDLIVILGVNVTTQVFPRLRQLCSLVFLARAQRAMPFHILDADKRERGKHLCIISESNVREPPLLTRLCTRRDASEEREREQSRLNTLDGHSWWSNLFNRCANNNGWLLPGMEIPELSETSTWSLLGTRLFTHCIFGKGLV